MPVNAQFSDAYKFLEAVRDKDAATAKHFDNPLAELPHPDAVLGDLRKLLGHAENVALRRVGIHAEQEIWRGQVEEAQRRA